MKRNKQVVPLIAVIILLSCLIVDGCGKKEETMAPPSPEVAVVTVANSAEGAMPKRNSLPSMLPPGCKSPAV